MILVAPAFAEGEADPELRARVETYWKAVEQQDWATTYKLDKRSQGASPLNPFDYYQSKNTQLRIRATEVLSIDQDGEQAVVEVKSWSLLPLNQMMVQIPRLHEATWERIEGEWYQANMQVVPQGSPDSAEEAAEGGAAPTGQPDQGPEPEDR
jgi:hypothetical protein